VSRSEKVQQHILMQVKDPEILEGHMPRHQPTTPRTLNRGQVC
jgi:hypothetical protein